MLFERLKKLRQNTHHEARRKHHASVPLLLAAVLLIGCTFSSDASALRTGRRTGLTGTASPDQAAGDLVGEAPVSQKTVAFSPKTDTRMMVIPDINSFGIVDGVNSVLNIRSAPSTDSSIIGYCVEFSALTITGIEGEWYRITYGEHSGYVHSAYVRVGEDGKNLAFSVCFGTAVPSENLKAYSVPAVTGTYRFTAETGRQYEIDKEYENWVRIMDEDGTKAFVKCEDVSIKYTLNQPYFYTPEDLENQYRQTIVNYAYQFLGLPYVWGGTSLTTGADCSGFVLRIYEHFGVMLPRTSIAQSQSGIPVNSISEAKVGDLIFYYGYSETGVRTSGVGHVAIYIGNGMILHCARNRGVIVTAYNYKDPPLCIRRVL